MSGRLSKLAPKGGMLHHPNIQDLLRGKEHVRAYVNLGLFQYFVVVVWYASVGTDPHSKVEVGEFETYDEAWAYSRYVQMLHGGSVFCGRQSHAKA